MVVYIRSKYLKKKLLIAKFSKFSKWRRFFTRPILSENSCYFVSEAKNSFFFFSVSDKSHGLNLQIKNLTPNVVHQSM